MKPESRDHLLSDARVHVRARELFRAVLRELRELGIPVCVVEVYRSPERQRQLYAQGRTDEALRLKGYTEEEIRRARMAGYTASKPVVTRVMGAGMHGRGRAMDCAFVVDGKLRYNVPESWWEIYGQVAKKHGLVWGGDWKSIVDKPHVEYRGE